MRSVRWFYRGSAFVSLGSVGPGLPVSGWVPVICYFPYPVQLFVYHWHCVRGLSPGLWTHHKSLSECAMTTTTVLNAMVMGVM